MTTIKYPICKKHGVKERLIGAEFGRFIYRCEKCLEEALKAIWKEGDSSESV